MKKILIILVAVLAIYTIAIPIKTFSAEPVAGSRLDYSGFVKCDGVLKPGEEGRQTVCDFNALMNTIVKAINWMFMISIPIATVLFAYAGLLYMTGTSGNRTKANSIFTSVAIGFIIMISAWFVIRTVVGWFVKDSSSATNLLGK